MKHRNWPWKVHTESAATIREICEKRLQIIDWLDEPHYSRAKKIWQSCERSPARARSQLYLYLYDEMENPRGVAGADQNAMKLLLGSLLPVDFDRRTDCEICLTRHTTHLGLKVHRDNGTCPVDPEEKSNF